MKVTELMIGDWVHCNLKYSSTSEEIDSYDCKIGSIDDDYNVNGNDIGCYQPILLTKEILEKNEMWHPLIEGSDVYKIKGIEFPKYIIQYVHQLQHAFRLVGLTELADNFVV